MTTLDDVVKEYQESAASATHLLLLGQTKFGKSDYCAQAAIDGWTLLYIDRDNGLSTLQERLKGNPEALRRVHYFNPVNLYEFMNDFVTSNVIRWSKKKRALGVTSSTVDPEDEVTEIYPARIPRNVIVCLDSWTSLAVDVIQKKADDSSIDLMDLDKYSREIYGGTGFKLTQIAQSIQASPFNWIVQGHPGSYERKEKPAGKVDAITEKDMIIKETIMVPVSTSLPHGYSIGKYFNQIGWIFLDAAGNRKLDYRTRPDRIGGGTPNDVKDIRKDFTWVGTFGKPPDVNPDAAPWIKTMTGAEFKEAMAAKHANAPKLTTTGIAKPAVPQAPVATITPPQTKQATDSQPASPTAKVTIAQLMSKPK